MLPQMRDDLPPLVLDDDTWLLVLTGAGVSAESGIPTFRDAGGLWETHRFEEVASPEGFANDPALVWRFYSERRDGMRACTPNAGHRALARLEERLGDRFLLATQNIDGLHAAAGSQRIVELHGNIWKTRCSTCDRPPFDDREAYVEKKLPACAKCHENGSFSLLRPHIVWFGEMLDPENLSTVQAFALEAMQRRFVFLAIGTSGAVHPAAGFVNMAKKMGADTWLVNADPPENASAFQHFVQGPSGEVLPKLFGVKV
jgi:NAD-dependent deacetylase